ncbi:MAG: hypothetical protein Q9169_006703 [Polycauliona sp. 2 TL-2023]
MVNAIVKATIQSALLTLCSALVATFLTPKDPPIVALVLFSIISTPKNFIWQQYLERKLPGYRVEKHEPTDEVKGAQSAGGGVIIKRKLNVTNTIAKVGIDQTFGALTNVALHLFVVEAMQGLPLAECLDVVKTVGLFSKQEDGDLEIKQDGFTEALSSTSKSAPQLDTANGIASQPESGRTSLKPVCFPIQHTYRITFGHNDLFTIRVRQAQGSLAVWQYYTLHPSSKAQVSSLLQSSFLYSQADDTDPNDMAPLDIGAHDGLVDQWRK